MKAVTLNAEQLGLSAMLGGLFIFFFTLIGFEFFPEDFFMSDISESGERTCTSLYRCFLHIFNMVSRLKLTVRGLDQAAASEM